MSAAVEQVITDSPRLPVLREYVINARTHRGVSIRSIAEMDLDMEQQWQEAHTQVNDRGETFKKPLIRGGQAHFENIFLDALLHGQSSHEWIERQQIATADSPLANGRPGAYWIHGSRCMSTRSKSPFHARLRRPMNDQWWLGRRPYHRGQEFSYRRRMSVHEWLSRCRTRSCNYPYLRSLTVQVALMKAGPPTTPAPISGGPEVMSRHVSLVALGLLVVQAQS